MPGVPRPFPLPLQRPPLRASRKRGRYMEIRNIPRHCIPRGRCERRIGMNKKTRTNQGSNAGPKSRERHTPLPHHGLASFFLKWDYVQLVGFPGCGVIHSIP